MRLRTKHAPLPLLVVIAFWTSRSILACSSHSASTNAAPHDAAVEDSGASTSFTCAPSRADTIDAGANIADMAGACVRDLACPSGQFCYAGSGKCVMPATVGDTPGNGQGARAADGGACVASLEFAVCDEAALTWTPSINVSRDPKSLVESDTVLAADGNGNLVAAWATIPQPATSASQINQLAVSHDDGATFTRIATPADAPNAASNDAVLAYDPSGLWYYAWEGYESDFHGAQHIWMSTSQTGDTWSAATQIDPPGDFQSGGALDFPWIAINPVTKRVYVTYEAVTATANGSERLVVVGSNARGADAGALDAGNEDAAADNADGGSAIAPSLSLTDGARPNAYPDLARGVFDSSGAFYTAWFEYVDQSTGTGGMLSGSTKNGIYFTRIDLAADGSLTPLAANVKVNAATDALDFEVPSIAVTPDGSKVYVAYASGTKGAIDIVLATSNDRGATFSSHVKVNDDATCATHMHPTLAMDPKGRLYVFFYDNRDGEGHFLYAVSDDEGKSFHPSRLVSAPSFPFDSFQYSTGWLGDYFEPAVTSNAIYVLWSDGRESDQSHAFFAKADLLK